MPTIPTLAIFPSKVGIFYRHKRSRIDDRYRWYELSCICGYCSLLQLVFLKDTFQMCVVGSHVVTTSADGFCECSFSSIFLTFFNHVRTAHNPKVVGSNPAPATTPKSTIPNIMSGEKRLTLFGRCFSYLLYPIFRGLSSIF